MTGVQLGFEAIFGSLAILALPWRLARTVLTDGMREKLKVFPRVAGTLLAVTATGALLIVLATRSATAWRGLVMASLVLLCAEAWRGRRVFGRRRRWPPGSLSIAPLGPWTDPEFYSKQAERHGTVFKFSNFVQPAVAVVDLEKARDLLRRYDAVLTVPPLPFDRFVPERFIRYLEPGPHRARSASLRAAISREVVTGEEPAIAAIVRDSLADLSRPEAGVPHWLILERMVFRGFAGVFFGFRPGTAAFDRFERVMNTVDFRRGFLVSPARLRRALEGAIELLTEERAEGFLGALAAADAGAARTPTILLNLIYVFNTAWADVSGLMTWLTRTLAMNPEWVARLRSAGDAAPMAERVVRETLRLSQSEYLTRFASEPLEIDGYVVPRGWVVRICIREIHRRADKFPDPQRFDPDRFLKDPPSSQVYAPFGASRVSCPGSDLTLTFGRLLALELARGYDLEVAADGPLEFGPFHWRPNDGLRVALRPRPTARVGQQPT